MEMHWEAERQAMLLEEAARVTARPRGHGMGAAALGQMRRQAEELRKKRTAEDRTKDAAQAAQKAAAKRVSPAGASASRACAGKRGSFARAALHQALRR